MTSYERRDLLRGLIVALALFSLLATTAGRAALAADNRSGTGSTARATDTPVGTALPVVGADTTPPTVTAPVQTFATGKVGSTVPITLKWSGSDSSGIKSYQLWRSTNGGLFVRDTTLPLTATSRNYSLTVGNSYRFFVRAYDNAGNASTRYGPTFRPTVADDRSCCVYFARGGLWTRVSSSQAYMGTLTKKPGGARGTARYAFMGRDIAYVASLGSDLGTARVYIDGLLHSMVNLNRSTSDGAQIVVSKHWTTVGAHTIEVTAYYGPAITVDAFVTNM